MVQCLTNSGDVRPVCGSSLGTTDFLMPITDSAMLIKLFLLSFYLLLVFGRNTCSWICYGNFPLSFHITAGLPINFRNKRTLLNRKVSKHFVRAKYYQHHISLCLHLKWQSSCHGINIQIHRQRSDLEKPLKRNEHLLDSIQALSQLDYK